MDFMSLDVPGVVLDQYLGGEELKGLILKEGTIFFTEICHRRPHGLMSLMIRFKRKHIKKCFEIFKNVFYNVASDL
jgi:hypothetical protein